ncbi:hypothetical protein BHE74_00017956 [Ensete ventricosum]|uniref:Uncharacterized protein n=1 Tax=Ensete ventricosum TaxID=4639 RepID=A0A426XSP9_ENSVE|nr:hypothetical protein B296_00042289 [Ensete ventricosum]RWW74117.1 hypothetical protein BHE74_00017956 [Ensete ventricosum]
MLGADIVVAPSTPVIGIVRGDITQCPLRQPDGSLLTIDFMLSTPSPLSASSAPSLSSPSNLHCTDRLLFSFVSFATSFKEASNVMGASR